MSYHDTKTPESERDLWATPPWLFNWLDSIYRFDVDLAASAKNYLCEIYYAKDIDALKLLWSAFGALDCGYCNPPYSDISPWVDKAIKEAENGFITVMVMPTPNGEVRYKKIFDKASEIIFINGRVAFTNSQGKAISGNTRGTCIVIFAKHFGSIRISHVDRDDLIKRYS